MNTPLQTTLKISNIHKCRVLLACMLMMHNISKLQAADYSLYAGEYVTLSINVPGVPGAISWAVGSPSHLNVTNPSSSTTGVGPISYFEGTETVTCYYAYTYYVGSTRNYGNGHISYSFSCKPVSIFLNKSNLSLAISETAQLSVTHSPSSAPQPEIHWESSDPNVATVDKGLVTAVGPGTAVITAGNNSGPDSPTCTVTVERIYPTSISLLSQVEINGRSTYRLTPELSPARATAKYTWTSTDESVATVISGQVRGISPGNAVITATTDNGLSALCSVKILPVEIESLKSGKKSIYVDEETSLGVSVVPSNATEGIHDFIYVSDNPSVVRIDDNGRMYGVAEGTATITVTGRSNPALTADYSITVIEANYAVGKKFKANTIENVQMTFVVLSSKDRTVEAGYYNEDRYKGYCIPKSTSGHVTIPDKIYGYTVVSIAEYAFEENKNLTSITVPNTVSKIGAGAFSDCPKLISIELPDSIMQLPSSLFFNDSSLVTVTIPQGIKSLPSRIFHGCTSLKNLSLSDSIKLMGTSVFSGCTSLESVRLPSFITKLPDELFKGCSSLMSIIIPSTVTAIGSDCFKDCSSLSLLQIPNEVKEILSGALDGSLWLELQQDGVIYINDILYTYKGKETMPEHTSIYVKEGTKSITGSAFYNCSNLSEIHLPNSITHIGGYAFRGCTGLTSIKIPNRITTINGGLCRDCTNLVDVSLPYSIQSIGNYAFEGCTKIQRLEIPANVTSFGPHAFAELSALKEVKSYIKEPIALSNQVFTKKLVAKCKLLVPSGTKSQYLSKNIWNWFGTIEEFEIPTEICNPSEDIIKVNTNEVYELSGIKRNGYKNSNRIVLTGGKKLFIMKR